MIDKEIAMSKQIEEILNEVLHEEEVEDKQIVQVDDLTIQIIDVEYKIIANHRQGFNKEAFTTLYHSFFEKYDFIVGDWGHEKLRLRGFYQIGKRKVPRDQQIDFLDDYIKEYCNFGCAYFVLGKTSVLDHYHRLKDKSPKTKPQQSKRRRTSNINTQAQNIRSSSPISNNDKDRVNKESSKNFKPNKVDNKGIKNKSPRKKTSNKAKKTGNEFIITRRKKGES